MTTLEYIEELDAKHAEYEKYCPKYAELLCIYENLKDARDSLKDRKKEVLSEYMVIDDMPEWKSIKQARDGFLYKQLLKDINNIEEALAEARTNWRKAWGVMEPIKLRIESLRTEISASKQEARSLGG